MVSLRGVLQLASLSFAILIVLGGAGQSAAAEGAKRGGTMTIGVDADMRLMNPMVGTSGNEKDYRQLIFESLLDMDEKGQILPNLAASWSLSSDGKVYTFELRRGVKFHSGLEMTAEDVKWSFDYTLNPENAAYGLANLNFVERAEGAGRYGIKFYLKKPSAVFLSLLTSIQSFPVVPKGSLEERVLKPVTFPPGTGPFKFVEWAPQQRIVYERHDDYWGDKAYLDRLILRPILDSTVRFNALRSGVVDLVQQAPLEWVKPMKEGQLKGVNYVQLPGTPLRVQFRVTAPPFDNKKLRQAVAHAVDKREVLAAATFGYGEVGDQKYPKGYAWHVDGLPLPSYDPDKARGLLKEAGYRGEPIEMTVQQQARYQNGAAVIQAQLRRVGMEVKLRVLESGAYDDLVRKGQIAFSFTAAGSPPDPSVAYGPDLVCVPETKGRSLNRTGYCNKEVEALLRQAEVEPDVHRRKSLFKQILIQWAGDLPEFYIGFTPVFQAYRDHVKDFKPFKLYQFRSLHHVWLDR